MKKEVTSNKNIDNVMLLGMAGEIAKKHINKGIIKFVQDP